MTRGRRYPFFTDRSFAKNAPAEPGPTVVDDDCVAQQLGAEEDIHDKTAESHNNILSFPDGDPEDPYNWPTV